MQAVGCLILPEALQERICLEQPYTLIQNEVKRTLRGRTAHRVKEAQHECLPDQIQPFGSQSTMGAVKQYWSKRCTLSPPTT